MTIKQIRSILPLPQTLNIQELSGKKIAIDTSIFLYKYKYVRPDNQDFVSLFDTLVKTLRKHNVTPIFVFDGKAPALKQKILDSRKELKRKQDESEGGRPAIRITKLDVETLQDFFDEHNVIWKAALGEAEKECCALESANEADFVLSNDYDTFLFGCNNLLRTTSKGTVFELYTWDAINAFLKLTRHEFRLLAISIGFDYLPSGIRGYGPKKSLMYLQKHRELPPNELTEELILEMLKEFEIERQ